MSAARLLAAAGLLVLKVTHYRKFGKTFQTFNPKSVHKISKDEINTIQDG